MATFKEILARCTGVSSPIFGVQWTAPVLDVQVARDLVKDLENRRVLFRPVDMEGPDHCLRSVEEIRETLTDALKKVDSSSPLDKQLRAMRKAGMHFCDKIGHPDFIKLEVVVQRSVLERELFALRTAFGKALSEIAIAHGLDVEDDLATIIPFNNLRLP